MVVPKIFSMNKLLIFFTFILLFGISVPYTFNQTKSSQDYFRYPVNIPVYLSGTYGELRGDHFHSGIDIKTQGEIGKKIRAIADGYISRIKITEKSYGKTLYVTHPNGYTSVYGHLKSFAEEVKLYVRKKQYKQQEFEVNLFPDRNRFRVNKGDVIAISGSSGYSFGPHLHFEIRHAENQHPLNPFLFGYTVEDNLSPDLVRLAIYPLGKQSLVNGKAEKLILSIRNQGSSFRIPQDREIQVKGKVGFGIETYDYMNGSNNPCGVYSIKMTHNGEMYYSCLFEEIPFKNTRYINSHIDYEAYKKSDYKIQRSFLQPNNQLNIYDSVKGDGIVSFDTAGVHSITYTVKDIFDNTSTLSFRIKTDTASYPDSLFRQERDFDQLMPYNKTNIFERRDIRLEIPPGALYDTLRFTYSKSAPNEEIVSPIHHVHDLYTPVHKRFTLSLRPTQLADNLINKALIVSLDEDQEWESHESDNVQGKLEAQVRKFGSYAVAVDTVKPTITPLNINKEQFREGDVIRFAVKDNLSGIATYRGYIDNKWALFEYDPKDERLTYTIDKKRLSDKTRHDLELFVIDKKNNIASYHTTFNY